MTKEQYFRKIIKNYYKLHKRSFFWRRKKLTPFQVMVAEIFLKKTKAEAVDNIFPEFIKRYPNAKNILRAKESTMFKIVRVLGLGHQRTAALKKIAKYVIDNFSNNLPHDIDKISKIPYVGDYSANATMCFGFNKCYPILDVNISRIISRVFAIENNVDLRNNVVLKNKARVLLPSRGFKEYNWGLLDFGASVCKPKPSCFKCPLKTKCRYYLDRA